MLLRRWHLVTVKSAVVNLKFLAVKMINSIKFFIPLSVPYR